MKNYGKIDVLCGGPSNEREISLRSGRAVHEALLRKGADVAIFELGEKESGALDGINCDIAFIALHGRFGEDGRVQEELERRGIKYTGSGARASKLAFDKAEAKKIFTENNVPTPRYKVIENSGAAKEVLSEFTAPFVVKPKREGSSFGVSIVRDINGFNDALERVFKYGETALVEEYAPGREITVGILEEKALPVIEIRARGGTYDFNAKYHDSGTEYIVPAELTKAHGGKAQETALRAHKALGCRDLSRVDMRIDDSGNIAVFEVNTIPGMTERSLLPKAAKAAGVDFGELCIKLIELSYRRN